MNNNTIRPVPLVITGLALVAISALLINAHRHLAVDTTQTATADAHSVCYILNKPTSSGHNDIAYLKLTSADSGQHATGELGVALAEKDTVQGTLSGTVVGNTDGSAVFDGQYTNTGEGVDNVSEQMIHLDENQATLGYGDMVKNGDGTYGYKDTSAVTYSLALPSVDCAQYDSLKTASN